MVTDISGAGSNYPVVGQTVSTGAQHVVEASGARSLSVSTGVDASQTPPETRVAGMFAKLQARQDAFTQAASVVRGVGDSANQAGQLLDKMEQGLGEIVKMYPPYPIDSPQRVTLLNAVSGLRKQIDELTFPPPEKLKNVERLLGQQKDGNGKDGSVPAPQDVASVVKGAMWDLSTLDPRSASDAEVSKALDQVNSLKVALKDVSAGMWNDVASFVKQADSPDSQKQGAGTREQLAGLGEVGIGTSGRLLEQAAESK